MSTELQKYLKSGESLQSLTEEPYNLIIKEEYPFVIFNYNQVTADFSIPLVKESRGIILDKRDWSIVCNPFKKFFNVGEVEYVDDIDLSRAVVYRKYDGSLVKLWYDFYNKKWRWSSNGMIDVSDVDVKFKGNRNENFQDLIDDIIGEDLAEKMYQEEKIEVDKTYMFELLHEQNPIVENIYKNKLVFIGMKFNDDAYHWVDIHVPSLEYKFEDIDGIESVELYDINTESFKDIEDEMNKINEENGEVFEGFIIANLDEHGDIVTARAKMKSIRYLQYHRLADFKSADNVFLEVIQSNDTSEFEAYLDDAPEYTRNRYFQLKDTYHQKVDELNDLVEEWKSYLDTVKETNPEKYKSEFGMEVQKRVSSFNQKFIFEYVYKNKTPKEVLFNTSKSSFKKFMELK